MGGASQARGHDVLRAGGSWSQTGASWQAERKASRTHQAAGGGQDARSIEAAVLPVDARSSEASDWARIRRCTVARHYRELPQGMGADAAKASASCLRA